MGGAFIAVADDATAAVWNPAGLAQIPQRQLQLGGGYLSADQNRKYNSRLTFVDPSSKTTFMALPSPGDAPLQTAVAGKSSKTYLDFVTFAQPFDLGNGRLVVAVSASANQATLDNYSSHSAFNTSLEYVGAYRGPLTAPGLDTSFRNEVDAKSYNLSAAYNHGDKLLVGVTLSHLDATQTVSSGLILTNAVVTLLDANGNPVVPATPFSENFKETWNIGYSGWSGTLGVMWRATDKLTVGATYRTKNSLSFDYRHGQELNQVSQGASGNSRVDTPAAVGLGLAFRPRPNWTLAVDFSTADWSRAMVKVHSYTPGQGDYNVYFPSLQRVTDALDYGGRQHKDTVLRVGSEYIVSSGGLFVPVRLGIYEEKAASGLPAQSQPTVNGYACGVGVQGRHVFADLTAVYETTTVHITNHSPFYAPELVQYLGGTSLQQVSSFAGTSRFDQKNWRTVASVGYRF
jgi:long-subunit fatty acid transport protein